MQQARLSAQPALTQAQHRKHFNMILRDYHGYNSEASLKPFFYTTPQSFCNNLVYTHRSFQNGIIVLWKCKSTKMIASLGIIIFAFLKQRVYKSSTFFLRGIEPTQ